MYSCFFSVVFKIPVVFREILYLARLATARPSPFYRPQAKREGYIRATSLQQRKQQGNKLIIEKEGNKQGNIIEKVGDIIGKDF